MRKTWFTIGLALALVFSGGVVASTAVQMDMKPVGPDQAEHDCPSMTGGPHEPAAPSKTCTLKCALACHYLSTMLYERPVPPWVGSVSSERPDDAVFVAEGLGQPVPTPPPNFA